MATSTTGFNYTLLTKGSGTKSPLFTAPLLVVWQVATGNPQALLNYFNKHVFAVENGLPEGAMVEATLTGWNVPLIGNIGQEVANAVNTDWQAGKIKDPTHPTEAIPAWPEFPHQLAWYYSSTDEVVLRYKKGQPWFLWILGAILLFLGLRAVLQGVGLWNGNYLYSLLGVQPTSTTPPTTTPPSTGMPVWEQILIWGGVATVGIGAIVFSAKLELAKAGSNRSSQEIIVER